MLNSPAQSAPQRRRGPELEKALLEATWAELKTVGYTQLTYDAVAKRAGTSRPILYKRWPKKHDLVLAAMRNNAPLLSGSIPDTGSIRGDVIAILERAAEQLEVVGQEVILGLLSDVIAMDMLSQRIRVSNVSVEIMTSILKRAEGRGEVNFTEIPEIVITLPLDLNRHEIITTGKAPSKAKIRQIVDGVFLPLVKLSLG